MAEQMLIVGSEEAHLKSHFEHSEPVSSQRAQLEVLCIFDLLSTSRDTRSRSRRTWQDLNRQPLVIRSEIYRCAATVTKKYIKLSQGTSVGSSHHRARLLVCWINVNKDVLNEFRWLFELQSSSCHKCGNDGMKKVDKRWRRKLTISLNKKLLEFSPTLE